MNEQRKISRRQALTIGTGALLHLRAGQLAARGRQRSRPPNIVFILADDLSAADLSCYGRPDFRTPNIDSLARDGMRLTQAYANSCTCSPTRVALMTGRYQNRIDLGNYDPLPPGRNLRLPDREPTLASVFRDAGYATALIGKWHLGESDAASPTKYGYQSFYGLRGSHVDYFGHTAKQIPSGQVIHDFYENEQAITPTGYATDLFTRRAIDYIEAHRGAPFFLSLHHTAPHWPWQAPNTPPDGRLNDQHYDGGSREIYRDMVLSLDRAVGQVLDAIDDAGLTSNTLVVFSSDNGGERYSYQWPLRGMKFDLWEGGIRVPCLVRWPKAIAARSQSEQLTLSMDWLPTLAAAARVAMPSSAAPDGMDITPWLLGREPTSDRAVFWRTQWARAARVGRWKYVATKGHEYLFDLSADPMERANLRRKDPATCDRLRQRFADWNATMRAIPDDARVPADLYERLEALEIG